MAKQIITKKCTKCNQIKQFSEFHKLLNGKYGIGSRCKQCRSIYEKRRYENNKSKIQQQHKVYKKTKNGKAANKRYGQKRYLNHPKKIKAYCAVHYAIKTGNIEPAYRQRCIICKFKRGEQYHHPDYNKPLYIFPVCKDCHREIHLLTKTG